MPSPNEAALAAIHEFLGIAQKKICPQPDKPESDWAKLKAAVDGLSLLAASQPSAVVLDDERAALSAALQRYLDCDVARDAPGDTPAAQARAALASAASLQATATQPASDQQEGQ
jgi:hypothetical protein